MPNLSVSAGILDNHDLMQRNVSCTIYCMDVQTPDNTRCLEFEFLRHNDLWERSEAIVDR